MDCKSFQKMLMHPGDDPYFFNLLTCERAFSDMVYILISCWRQNNMLGVKFSEYTGMNICRVCVKQLNLP